jgi:hypothetical protein
MHWIKKKVRVEDRIEVLIKLLNEVNSSLTHGKFVKVIDSYDRLADNFARHNHMVNELKGIVSIIRATKLK